MQYFGGKAKIAKELSVFLQSKIQPNQTFVDLFCGSCNVVSKIQAKERIANDLHKELIALHIAVQQGQELPSVVSEEDYKDKLALTKQKYFSTKQEEVTESKQNSMIDTDGETLEESFSPSMNRYMQSISRIVKK